MPPTAPCLNMGTCWEPCFPSITVESTLALITHRSALRLSEKKSWPRSSECHCGLDTHVTEHFLVLPPRACCHHSSSRCHTTAEGCVKCWTGLLWRLVFRHFHVTGIKRTQIRTFQGYSLVLLLTYGAFNDRTWPPGVVSAIAGSKWFDSESNSSKWIKYALCFPFWDFFQWIKAAKLMRTEKRTEVRFCAFWGFVLKSKKKKQTLD